MCNLKNSYEIIVDIRKPNESYNIEFSQNSLNTSELIIRVVEDGKPFVLKDTDIIIVAFKKPDRTTVLNKKK